MEWSLIRGESVTGVTVFWLDEGMDTGPIQAQAEFPVGNEEDSITLRRALIDLGIKILENALKKIAAGQVTKTPQSGESSPAPKLSREEAWVDFNRPALDLHNRVRGLAAGPKAFIRLSPSKLVIALVKTTLPTRSSDHSAPSETENQAAPGTVLAVERDRGILIQCISGQIWVVVVQPEGKRQIPAADFVNGLRMKPGDRLTYFTHD